MAGCGFINIQWNFGHKKFCCTFKAQRDSAPIHLRSSASTQTPETSSISATIQGPPWFPCSTANSFASRSAWGSSFSNIGHLPQSPVSSSARGRPPPSGRPPRPVRRVHRLAFGSSGPCALPPASSDLLLHVDVGRLLPAPPDHRLPTRGRPPRRPWSSRTRRRASHSPPAAR
jgi:hypothetical protein